MRHTNQADVGRLPIWEELARWARGSLDVTGHGDRRRWKLLNVSMDRHWLAKVTIMVNPHWRRKNARNRRQLAAETLAGPATVMVAAVG